jgi:hypothetical protein
MRLGELSDDICNRLDSEITMVTISNVPTLSFICEEEFNSMETGRSWVRDPMKCMIFISLSNPSGGTWPWGLLSL